MNILSHRIVQRLSWVVWTAFVLATNSAFGLNIILESFSNSTHPAIVGGTANDSGVPLAEEPPGFDSDSSDLLAILQEIESRYQDAFKDSQTIRITYLWDTNTPFSGQARPGWVVEDNNGDITHAVVRFNPNRNWYVDPTPANDSEFNMDQVLYRYGDNTLTGTERLANFSGTVPDVFEAGYNGLADPNGPAGPDGGGNQLDLLTVAFQEVGHALGVSSGFPGNIVTNNGNPVSGEAADSDWDVDPDFVRGAVMAMRAPGVGSNGPFAHLVGNDAVMANLGSNERTRPSAADYFAIAATQGWTTIDLPRQDFLGGTNWSTAGNWTGNQVPGSADDAYVRSALNNSVLTASLTANVSARNLNVENGSNVDVNSYKLDLGNDATVTGLDSDIFINPGGELEADEIFIRDQSEIQMTGGLVDTRRLTIDEGTQLEGVSGGSMTIDVSQRLVNNGVIDVDDGAVMTFVSAATSAWDLDGNGSGDGELFANGGNLIFDSGGVTDIFNGTMTVAAGFYLRIDADWTFGNGAVLDLNGGSGPGNSARMVGGTISISGGTIDVDDVGGDGLSDGKVEFDAPVEITGGTFSVGLSDRLDFDNTTTVANGTFTLAQNATINFDGTTTVDTADFNFAGAGEAVFNGPTTYSFNTQITANGLIRQDGDATIIGSMTVNGGIFDLDGTAGTTTIVLGNISNNGSLLLNVDGIDTTNNTFNGTIETAEAGIVGAMTINFTNPADSWQMAGTLNLAGVGGPFFQPVRIAGAKMVVTGTVNVANNRVAIAADTIFNSTSTINTAGLSAELVMRGVTVVGAGADFNGLGTLVNGFGGDMTLFDGLDTAFVDLENEGTLRLGASPGQVETNGFVQKSSGVWEVEIAGSLAAEFDALTVDSTAELAGKIRLSLLDGYVPWLGQTFTILTAPFGVSGAFDTVLGGVDGDTRLGLLYEPAKVQLFATFSADFDLDGDVDADDLAQWQGDYGLNGMSDADGDGDSDGSDFLAWQQQFGSALPRLTFSQTVPEPGSLLLGVLAVLLYATISAPRHFGNARIRRSISWPTPPVANGFIGLLATALRVYVAMIAMSIAFDGMSMARGEGASVQHIPVPNGGIEPQAAVDDHGTIHLVYFLGEANQGNLFYVLHRSATEGIHRDIYMLSSSDHGKNFQSQRVHNWRIQVCPMSSMSFAETHNGVCAAWETEGQVYWARVDRNFTVSPPFAPTGLANQRKYPALATNPTGQTLLAWNAGARWGKAGTISWQIFDQQGKPIGEPSTGPKLPKWSFSAAIALNDGSFRLLY